MIQEIYHHDNNALIRLILIILNGICCFFAKRSALRSKWKD